MITHDEYTQLGRPIAVDTPLGPDAVLLRSFEGREEISRLFRLDLDLLSLRANILPGEILGRKVTVRVESSATGEPRFFNGHVSRWKKLPTVFRPGVRLHHYQAEIVPWFWFLTRTADCRIFQFQTVPEIIETVFRDFGFADFDISGIRDTHAKWEYCVQYRETAFAFLSRLMEQEGIFYYFRHEESKHTLMLGDVPAANKPCPHKARVEAELGGPLMDAMGEERITQWRRGYSYRSGRWSVNDFDFIAPRQNLLAGADSIVRLNGNHRYEIYDYPGEYRVRDEGEHLADLRMEEEEASWDVVEGAGSVRDFSPGFRFTLDGYDQEDQNAEYLLTVVEHSGSSPDFFSESAASGEPYRNRFTAIPSMKPFRPLRVTPLPRIRGPQTAIVAGRQGEEIFTDPYGRVKVQFHWDRRGRSDETSSCWIRVSQAWAGKNWGFIANPRIGQEVIVEFLEGDPDRPIITGRVYNAEQMPPYELPAHQSQSGIKSRSTKHGCATNFNEIRFEDEKGAEEIYIHAERDETLIVEHDKAEIVGNNEQILIGHNRQETVEGNESLQVRGARDRSVWGGERVWVLQCRSHKIGIEDATAVYGNQKLKVAGDQEIKIGLDIIDELMKELTFAASASALQLAKRLAGIGSQAKPRDLMKLLEEECTQAEEQASSGEDVKAYINLVKVLAKIAAIGTGNRKTTIRENDTLDVGKEITITAGDQITLQTGKSRIEMKKNGMISILGDQIKIHATNFVYSKGLKLRNKAEQSIISDAGMTHTIKGGLVQIN